MPIDLIRASRIDLKKIKNTEKARLKGLENLAAALGKLIWWQRVRSPFPLKGNVTITVDEIARILDEKNYIRLKDNRYDEARELIKNGIFIPAFARDEYITEAKLELEQEGDSDRYRMYYMRRDISPADVDEEKSKPYEERVRRGRDFRIMH